MTTFDYLNNRNTFSLTHAFIAIVNGKQLITAKNENS